MKEPRIPSIHETWGKREYIESWDTRMDWQRPLREMQLKMVDLMIPQAPEAPIRILDLAAGYGALASFLLAERAHATAICIDASEEMLNMGRERAARFGNRVEFIRRSLEGPDWLKAIEGPFDAVVSSRALHHFTPHRRRRAIYGELLTLLRPGGCFINADNMKASTGSLHQRYRTAGDRLLERYVAEITDGKKTLAQMKKENQLPSHGPHDNGRLEQELAWLRELGYDDVDCFWKFGNYAVYGGFRSAS
jgi:SAM-dependent methyltransferase